MRRLLAVALLAASTIVAPFAAAPAALAAPSAVSAEAPAAAYMDRLLGEINARRARVGTPALTYVAPAANQAVSQYLTDLTPPM